MTGAAEVEEVKWRVRLYPINQRSLHFDAAHDLADFVLSNSFKIELIGRCATVRSADTASKIPRITGAAQGAEADISIETRSTNRASTNQTERFCFRGVYQNWALDRPLMP